MSKPTLRSVIHELSSYLQESQNPLTDLDALSWDFFEFKLPRTIKQLEEIHYRYDLDQTEE